MYRHVQLSDVTSQLVLKIDCHEVCIQ